MITLEQIRALDAKVEDAVAMIRTLTQEKRDLHDKLESYRQRIDELERLVNRFKEDQGKIEEGIEGAIRKLDSIEDGDTTEAAPNPSTADVPEAPDSQDSVAEPTTGAPARAESSPDRVPDAPTEDLSDDEDAEGEEPSVAELDIF